MSIASKPINRYLIAHRMEETASLIESSDDGIAEIAARVGYETASAFSKLFRRYHGASPGRFRAARRTTSHCNSETWRGSASTWRRRPLWVECLLARPAVRDTAPPPIQGDEKCGCNRPPRPMRGVSRTCVKS